MQVMVGWGNGTNMNGYSRGCLKRSHTARQRWSLLGALTSTETVLRYDYSAGVLGSDFGF